MKKMNRTIISGRLVRDPGYNEVQSEKGEHKIAKFVLAVRRNYSDEASFIPVKAFAKKAEFVRDYLVQGTKVIVEGEIITGNYESKETGKRVYTTEIYASQIEFAGPKMTKQPGPAGDSEGFMDLPDEDLANLPFN
jgi:single-strand DNA-binding protein